MRLKADTDERRTVRESKTASEPDDKKVGYKRPPKAHQFKPGESGNPSGERKGPKSEAAILHELLNRKIPIRQAGRISRIPLLEAILRKAAEEALRGDLKATAFLLNRLAANQSNDTTTSDLSVDETEVMKAYAARLLKQAKDQEEDQ